MYGHSDAVLYEMLAGEQAFAEEDVSETLAAVLKSEPDWTRIAPTCRRQFAR